MTEWIRGKITEEGWYICVEPGMGLSIYCYSLMKVYSKDGHLYFSGSPTGDHVVPDKFRKTLWFIRLDGENGILPPLPEEAKRC